MRLIDSEHLTKWILSWWKKTEPISEYLKGADILNQIDREPTIDAVEVVRCNECKHYSVEGETTRFGWCGYWNKPTDEMRYCSDGEREGE